MFPFHDLHRKQIQFIGISYSKWKSSYGKGQKCNSNWERTIPWLKKASKLLVLVQKMYIASYTATITESLFPTSIGLIFHRSLTWHLHISTFTLYNRAMPIIKYMYWKRSITFFPGVHLLYFIVHMFCTSLIMVLLFRQWLYRYACGSWNKKTY